MLCTTVPLKGQPLDAKSLRHELPSDGKSLLWLEAAVCREGASCQASVAAAQLCASTTREFLERLLAAKRWRALLEDGTGARLVAAMGMPMQELMGVLDCVQPPPGAEMPVALAQLLRRTSPQNPENPENPASPFESMHAVVDAGAPALAVQLQSVPPAVAEGLGGVLRLQDLVRAAKQAAVPSAVTSGLQMLIGASADDREDWRDAFKATVAWRHQCIMVSCSTAASAPADLPRDHSLKMRLLETWTTVLFQQVKRADFSWKSTDCLMIVGPVSLHL